MPRSQYSSERLVRSWIALQKNWWAHEELADACEKHPQKAWRVLVRLTTFISTKDLVEIFGAGPLEDFIRFHAPRFIDEIEILAKSRCRFRDALQVTLLPRSDDNISKRLFALGCKPIDSKLTQWQRLSRTRRRKVG